MGFLGALNGPKVTIIEHDGHVVRLEEPRWWGRLEGYVDDQRMYVVDGLSGPERPSRFLRLGIVVITDERTETWTLFFRDGKGAALEIYPGSSMMQWFDMEMPERPWMRS